MRSATSRSAISRSAGSPRPRTQAALVRIAGLAVLLLVGSFVAYRLGWFDYRHTVQHLDRIRRSHSIWAFGITFVAIYAVGTSVGFPGLPFTVAAGALFGTFLGSALSWIGAMFGAMIGYTVARTIGHDVVARWLQRYERAGAAVGQANSFQGMLRLRLIPVIPLGTVNFVAGLARSPVGIYMAATAIGIIPSTLIYNYFADSLVEGVGGGKGRALVSLLLASALLILLSLVPRLLARQRRGFEAPPAISGRSAPGD
jgi:uncharacterized membrane protein YdjX (TVP38/TMEM64 family)